MKKPNREDFEAIALFIIAFFALLAVALCCLKIITVLQRMLW